jgi:molecular chaperone DnaK
MKIVHYQPKLVIRIPVRDNDQRFIQIQELIEAKNQADSLIYETEKSLREHGDKVDSAIKNSIEEDLKNLKENIAKSDASAEEIKKSTESLMQNSMKLGEAIYKNSQGAQQSEGTSNDAPKNDSSSNEDGKVVDGEYEVNDDKKSFASCI